jgi:asparagine synthase (glutamine-hydrolysing)
VTRPEPFRLAPLEQASGLVFGHDRLPRPQGAADGSPLEAFERALLPALRRSPCFVAFSGGRDSSAALAAAAHAARREQLPLPIPVSYRFPDAANTDENEWQEAVVSHLQLDDWVRLDLRDELDIVGELAQDVLRRHGLLWPFNAHFLVPALRLASGGSLLTGVGGDEMLGTSRWARIAAVLAGRDRPEVRDAPRLGLALAPAPLRRLVARRRTALDLPWLRPAALAACHEAWVASDASEPVRWRARVEWSRGLRYLQAGMATLDLLGRDHDVTVAHPFASPEFSLALGAVPLGRRFYDRTQAMSAVFGEILPRSLIARAHKSSFDEVFWTDASRRVAESWDGRNVDENLVDVDRLRAMWSGGMPDARTYLLLQSIWLAAAPELRMAAG